MKEKALRFLFWVDHYSNIIISAFWGGNCIYWMFNSQSGVFILCGMLCFLFMEKHTAKNKYLALSAFAETQMMLINELSEEFGKAVGPKAPNDIIRKYFTVTEVDKDDIDPPKTTSDSFWKKATGET